MFQFPSNGKAYPKILMHVMETDTDLSFNSLQTGKRIQRVSIVWSTRTLSVSIPFKRESVSKEFLQKEFRAPDIESFNSLQTGKRIQRTLLQHLRGEILGFNSLQTGKRIQREINTLESCQLQTVSIPFKRESVSKANGTPEFAPSKSVFQFPSNGKAYPKQENVMYKNPFLLVSIPFKRESVSKVPMLTIVIWSF